MIDFPREALVGVTLGTHPHEHTVDRPIWGIPFRLSAHAVDVSDLCAGKALHSSGFRVPQVLPIP